jgi:hypothetical protein
VLFNVVCQFQRAIAHLLRPKAPVLGITCGETKTRLPLTYAGLKANRLAHIGRKLSENFVELVAL